MRREFAHIEDILFLQLFLDCKESPGEFDFYLESYALFPRDSTLEEGKVECPLVHSGSFT